MTKKTGNSGRPPVLADADVVFVDGRASNTILQSGSDRRAVVNRLVELGGRATVLELNSSFGYDVRPVLLALKRQGWIDRAAKKAAVLPRRTKTMARGDA